METNIIMFSPTEKIKRCHRIFSQALCASLLLSSCSGLKSTPPENPEKPISVITGKTGGIKLFGDINKAEIGNIIPVNALLWRAALDIASFVPLDDVDTFGGSIITEWHQSPENPDQRLKITIFVNGLELRSDAVKVKTYVQKKSGNDWIDIGRDDTLARKLEDLILSRAREIRAASNSETNL
jgi:hypothetical protein